MEGIWLAEVLGSRIPFKGRHLISTAPAKTNAGGEIKEENEMIRVYVKNEAVPPEVVESMRQAEESKFFSYQACSKEGQKYHRDGNGYYIKVDHSDDGLPSSVEPGSVREVSLREEFKGDSPRINGKYEEGDARAVVESSAKDVRVSDGMGDFEWTEVRVQNIRVHGATFDGVVALYEAIMAGSVQPKVSWNKPHEPAAEAPKESEV